MIYDIVLHELALYKSTIGPLTNYQLWDEKYDTNRDLIHNYNTKKLCFFFKSPSPCQSFYKVPLAALKQGINFL